MLNNPEIGRCSLFPSDSVKESFLVNEYLSCEYINYCLRMLMNWIDKYELLSTIWVVGLRPLDCWDRVFKFHWKHGCSSPVFVAFGVGNVLCDGLFTRPEESYRVCLILCGLETSTASRPRPNLGCCATDHKYKQHNKQGVVGTKKYASISTLNKHCATHSKGMDRDGFQPNVYLSQLGKQICTK